MALVRTIAQEGGQIDQFLPKGCGAGVPGLKRTGAEWQAAGGLADAQIDPPRRQRGQNAELFGDLVGAVMLQQHSPRSDADLRGTRQNIGGEYFWRRSS